MVASVSSEVVGVELDRKVAERHVARGYTVVAGNAETMDLGRYFDVVWAGEVIEHLSNAGAFLDSVRRHLHPGGVLILTTPNTFAIAYFIYRIGGTPRINKGHTCWYQTKSPCRSSWLVTASPSSRSRTSATGHPGHVRAALAGTVRAALPAIWQTTR